MNDSDFNIRGYVQHRRALSDGVNGDGAPLVNQVLEGEIAINLTSRKLYTKRPTFSYYPGNGVNNGFPTEASDFYGTPGTFAFTYVGPNPSHNPADYNSGYIITVNDITADSDTTVGLTLDPDGVEATSYSVEFNDSDNITTFTNRLASTIGADLYNSTTNQIFINRSDTLPFRLEPDADFNAHVDITIDPIVKLRLNEAISGTFTEGASTFDIFENTTGSTFRSRASGTFVAYISDHNDLYLSGFQGSRPVLNDTDWKLIRKETDGADEIIELNNIPLVSFNPPTTALAAGNMYIDRDTNNLYWLDTTIISDSDVQYMLRNVGNDSDRINTYNAVQFDSDGVGNPRYAEWRVINSPSLSKALTDESNIIAGDTVFTDGITVNGVATFDSDVTISGDLDVANNVTISGDLDIDGDVTIRKSDDSDFTISSAPFTIKNVSGTVVFEMWGLSDGSNNGL